MWISVCLEFKNGFLCVAESCTFRGQFLPLVGNVCYYQVCVPWSTPGGQSLMPVALPCSPGTSVKGDYTGSKTHPCIRQNDVCGRENNIAPLDDPGQGGQSQGASPSITSSSITSSSSAPASSTKEQPKMSQPNTNVTKVQRQPMPSPRPTPPKVQNSGQPSPGGQAVNHIKSPQPTAQQGPQAQWPCSASLNQWSII